MDSSRLHQGLFLRIPSLPRNIQGGLIRHTTVATGLSQNQPGRPGTQRSPDEHTLCEPIKSGLLPGSLTWNQRLGRPMDRRRHDDSISITVIAVGAQISAVSGSCGLSGTYEAGGKAAVCVCGRIRRQRVHSKQIFHTVSRIEMISTGTASNQRGPNLALCQTAVRRESGP